MSEKKDMKQEEQWERIQKFCRSFQKENDNDFERYLSESWFSNTLSWLLNPKESHGLGVTFSNAFLVAIAKERTEGCKPWYSDVQTDYLRRSTMLKWRRNTKKGQSPIGLSLKNAFPVTEFYLSRDPKIKRDKRVPSYIDVLFLDMDLSDGIAVTIENKLFTVNHPNQLEYYYASIESKFSTATIREYVYLTLLGDAPIPEKPKTGEKSKKLNQWVCLSWIDDVRSILEELTHTKTVNADVLKLLDVLKWLGKCHPNKKDLPINDISAFRTKLVECATDCLLEELSRLGGDKRGSWELKKYKQRIANTLVHSSYSARELHVNLLPNLTITITGKDAKGGIFEKVIVPFGCNADQMYNLIDIAAKDIYLHFFITSSTYLDSKRRKRVLSKKKLVHKAFFNFVCDYATALRLLLTFSSLKHG